MLLESVTVVVSGATGPVARDNHDQVPIVSLLRRRAGPAEPNHIQVQGESEGEDTSTEQQQSNGHDDNDELVVVAKPHNTTTSITNQQRQATTLNVATSTTPDTAVVTSTGTGGGCTVMADKRRYYERDTRTDNNNSYGNSSDAGSRHSGSSAGAKGHGGSDYDGPPNSRLFILCGRNVTEEDLRDVFAKFGEIKELWIVKDKSTGESKGVAYITYSKTSEAAVAMEEMNGKFIGNNAKSLKVLIANSRDQGSRREMNEEERLLRLFIICPRSTTEAELKDHFSQFGDVERCSIVRERRTKESKGYAYITFHRISHAAKAYEGCDRSFKPKFADPRPQKPPGEDRYSSAHGSTTGPYDVHEYSLVESYPSIMNHHHDQHSHLAIQHSSPPHGVQLSTPTGSSLLTIVAHGSVNQDQLWRLCDFFPQLDYCNARHDTKSRQVFATAVYKSPQAAAYAKEKLHGFEYPPGNRLIVKFDTSSPVERPPVSGSLLGPPVSRYSVNGGVQSGGALVPHGGGRTPPITDLARISETFAQAQSLLQAQAHHMSSYNSAGSGTSTLGESYDPSYCSVKLPGPQPLAPMDSAVMERLFVVCQPSPPQLYALKDVFGRFGSLIDIFMLNGKNFGYAKYASKVSADEAKSVLHGQEVCGMRLKVFHAEPQDQQKGGGASMGSGSTPPNSSDPKCKRLRMDVKSEEVD